MIASVMNDDHDRYTILIDTCWMIGVTAGTPCRIVLDKSTNFYSSVHFSMPFPCAIYYQPRNLGSSHFLYFRSILSALALALNCEEWLHNYLPQGGLLTTNTMLPSYLAPRPDFYKSSLHRYVISQARITNAIILAWTDQKIRDHRAGLRQSSASLHNTTCLESSYSIKD